MILPHNPISPYGIKNTVLEHIRKHTGTTQEKISEIEAMLESGHDGTTYTPSTLNLAHTLHDTEDLGWKDRLKIAAYKRWKLFPDDATVIVYAASDNFLSRYDASLGLDKYHAGTQKTHFL